MVDLNKLKEIIDNRLVVIMLHGKSIEGLENTITELKDIDICYTGLNYFDVLENSILTKINKHLDFVYDSAGIVPECVQIYENQVRIPRLSKYLDRNENNLWITTQGLMNIIMFETNNEYFIEKYRHKMLLIDELNIRLNVPNSSVLLLGLAIIGGAKKIVICGMDGYKGEPKDLFQSYYKPALFIEHCRKATGLKNTNLVIDSVGFEKEIQLIINSYATVYNMGLPPIVNCSPNSMFTVFEKIPYSKLKEWITTE